MNSVKRIWCWWRGYHRETPETGRFRLDVGGWCCDCGKVKDGENHEQRTA
jgi:hypothetical protein